MQLQQSPDLDDKTLEKICRYPWPGNVRELRNFLERSIIMSGGKRIDSAHLESVDACPTDRCWTLAFPPVPSLDEVVRDLKRDMVLESLRHTGGNRQAASELLGISRFSLRRLLASLGLDVR